MPAVPISDGQALVAPALCLAEADRTMAEQRDIIDLFGDTAVGPARLLPDVDADRLAAQVLDISRRAQANRDEPNIETLYIACGIATWKKEDGGRPAEAPIVLLPVGEPRRRPAVRARRQVHPIHFPLEGRRHSRRFDSGRRSTCTCRAAHQQNPASVLAGRWEQAPSPRQLEHGDERPGSVAQVPSPSDYGGASRPCLPRGEGIG